jgi:glutaredoxin-like YruB-family protein
MNIKELSSFEDLQKQLTQSKKTYLLIYKSGAEKSDCAYSSVKSAVEKSNENIQVLSADVNEVKDIHEKYGIETAPTLLYFEGKIFKQAIKGCQSDDYYVSLFKNAIYISQGTEKKAQKRVIVYSTPTCPHCNSLKDYLKTNQIAFRDIDVSKDQKMAQELVMKSGQQGVPQTEINGKIVVGFNRAKINEMLGINA